jgi:hypothetical protein
MAISAELIEFVKDGLRRGIPRRDLDGVLRDAGWDGEQVRGAIARFSDVEFAIPVPRPTQQLNSREVFMYVLMFSTLYLSAYHLGSLMLDLINQAFPDPAADRYQVAYVMSTIRWALASLLVAFPVFLLVARRIGQELRADVTKRASTIRRNLTYLTLFIAAIVLIGDTTTLLYNFLGGELTIRFILKVAVVAAIAGTGFGYYLRELRDDSRALAA